LVLSKPLAGNFLFQAAVALSQIVVVPFFVLEWGVAEYGAWLSTTALLVLLSFSDLGYLSIVSNVLNKLELSKYRVRASRLFFSVVAISFVQFVIFGSIVNGVVLLLFPDQYQLSHLFFSLYVFFFALSVFIANSTRANAQYHVFLFVNSGFKFLEIISVIFVLSWGGGWLAIAITYFFLSVVNFLISFGLCIKYKGFSLPKVLVIARLYKVCSGKAFNAFLVPISMTGLLQVSVVILEKFYGPDKVVFFVTARTLTRLVVQFVNVVNSSFWGWFSMLIKNGSNAAIMEAWSKYQLLINVSVSSFILFFIIFGESVYQIWTGIAVGDNKASFFVIMSSSVISSLWVSSVLLLMVSNRHGEFSKFYSFLVCLGLFACYLIGPISFFTFTLTLCLVELIMYLYVFRKRNLVFT